ncbi:hypothetical protein AHAS_Ahas12G0137900 [Arachis hypogaea]
MHRFTLLAPEIADRRFRIDVSRYFSTKDNIVDLLCFFTCGSHNEKICDGVAVASLLNATLVIPKFLYSNVWNDPSKVCINLCRKINLQSNTALNVQQEKRLKQMGATVRNAGSYIERLKLNQEREKLARKVMEKMSVEQLSDLLSFYNSMGQICNEVLEIKIHGLEIVNENECVPMILLIMVGVNVLS